VSHEFFHVWNVKRIHPKPLGPFDYRRENHTRQLWTMEGVTSYYEKRFVAAAGLYPKERFLERIADEIASLQTQPGRARQSLQQSSFDAWIKHYRPDENSGNVSISYYQKGALVAMMLDLEIRALTLRSKCLDDVVKHLAHQATLDDAGFAEPDGYLDAVCTVAGEHGARFASSSSGTSPEPSSSTMSARSATPASRSHGRAPARATATLRAGWAPRRAPKAAGSWLRRCARTVLPRPEAFTPATSS
jgi:predicted metalloprotease with PDZ domain